MLYEEEPHPVENDLVFSTHFDHRLSASLPHGASTTWETHPGVGHVRVRPGRLETQMSARRAGRSRLNGLVGDGSGHPFYERLKPDPERQQSASVLSSRKSATRSTRGWGDRCLAPGRQLPGCF